MDNAKITFWDDVEGIEGFCQSEVATVSEGELRCLTPSFLQFSCIAIGSPIRRACAPPFKLSMK